MASRLKVELHPLQNAEVLSTIFSFCSVPDLKTCRLVGSKSWLTSSLTSWRDKAVLVIKPEAGGRQVKGISFEDLQALYKDKEDPHELRKKPFKSIKLEGFNFKTGKHSELPWILDNLSLNRITHFGLKDYQFSTKEDFLDMIFLRMPNLVELKLENHVAIRFVKGDKFNYPQHQKLKTIRIQMDPNKKEIFQKHFPCHFFLSNISNLEKLQIKSPPNKLKANSKSVREIMATVGRIRKGDGSKLRIKHLDLFIVGLSKTGFTNYYPEEEKSMPLERFIGTVVDIVDVEPYVETLDYLDLFFCGKEHCIIPDGKIALPKLKEFHADGLPSQVFKNLNKLEAVEMETLLIDDTDANFKRPKNRDFYFRDSAKINLANASFGNVTKLECYNSSVRYLIDLGDFQNLSRSMPNVKHAKMPLTREAFRELCKAWPNLLTLTISDNWNGMLTKIDDETITGMEPNPDVEVLAEGNRPPNITNLKLLTDFVYSGTLTGHSVKFGFLQLARLHYLNVKLREISEEEKSALQKKVNVLEEKF